MGPQMSKPKKSKPLQNDDDTAPADGKLKGKDYERELARLHVELVKLQQWVVHKGLKICVVFEGRDGAGKDGTIKAIQRRLGCTSCGQRLRSPRPQAAAGYSAGHTSAISRAQL